MLLVLPAHQIRRQALGATVPVIFDPKTNKIAQPNTSLAHTGEVKWGCADWVIFHKGLVQWFKEGRFASKIKYSDADARTKANEVVSQHWEKNAGAMNALFCGHTSDFYNYFVGVGLGPVVTHFVQKVTNAASNIASKTVTSVEKITGSVQNTLVNTVDSAGNIVQGAADTLGNFTNVAKYVVPAIAVGAVALVGGYVYKNYIKGDARVTLPAGVKI